MAKLRCGVEMEAADVIVTGVKVIGPGSCSEEYQLLEAK